MSIHMLIIYIIASFLLNMILTKLESKKKDCFIDFVIISNIYMIVLSGILDFYKLTNNNDNIFLIILFLVIGKILYLSLVKERSILKNHDYHLKKYLFTLVSSYFINILVINQVDSIFPSMENVKMIIWLLIVAYVFVYIKKNIDIKIPVDNNILFYQDREYVVMQYAKYKNLYDSFVQSKYQEITLLLYAIMIYENYNRPEFIRKLDYLKYKLFRKNGKFGIMQVEKNIPITDIESIDLSKKKLERIYATNIKDRIGKLDIIKILIKKYYKKEMKEIILIYQIINKFNQK